MRYQAMIGVGGIGSGSFFLLNGDATLGREESRGGRFLDRRDYCKLHIISHYVKALLGEGFTVIPVGKVGIDDPGARLINEMRDAGLDLRYIEQTPDAPTLFSFCFVYPDGSGGNMTTSDSACSRVGPDLVRSAEPEFARFAGAGVALAAPEVSLDARRALLEMGTKHSFFRVASFTSEELPEAVGNGMLSMVDLLALNADEAATLAGIDSDTPPDEIARAAADKFAAINPRMLLSVTAGARGSWAWDGTDLTHQPIFAVETISTAGAGDAHLSGVIAGLNAGLPLAEAQQLGSLTAAMSVTSPHTINPDISRRSLGLFARQIAASIPSSVRSSLED